jgi:hypothetical protein
MTEAEIIANLEQFDDGFSVPAAPALPSPMSQVCNGFFTITFPDGSHRTLRIRTKKLTAKFAPGQRVLGLLVGPENESDYLDFSFVDERGPHVWQKHRGTERERLAALLWRLATGGDVAGHTLSISKRCMVCNRVLTTPESVAAGVGPTCVDKLKSVKY